MSVETPSDKPYYVSPKELKEELQKYFDSNPDPSKRVISNRLGKMLINIAYRYASKSNFHNYSWKDEMVSFAIYKMVLKLNLINLNLKNCNPFSYLTYICHHCFSKTITKYKKETERLRKLQAQTYLDFLQSEGVPGNRRIIADYQRALEEDEI
jgi:hypothetical protein